MLYNLRIQEDDGTESYISDVEIAPQVGDGIAHPYRPDLMFIVTDRVFYFEKLE